jgi:hypothetical protein
VNLNQINFNDLYNAFENLDSKAIINWLNTYKLSDITKIRGRNSDRQDFYALNYDENTDQLFQPVYTTKDYYNILQLAIDSQLEDVVKFILYDYKFLGTNKQWRKVDPRILLENRYNRDDETLTLRIAIQREMGSLLTDLWSYYAHLYTDEHFY